MKELRLLPVHPNMPCVPIRRQCPPHPISTPRRIAVRVGVFVMQQISSGCGAGDGTAHQFLKLIYEARTIYSSISNRTASPFIGKSDQHIGCFLNLFAYTRFRIYPKCRATCAQVEDAYHQDRDILFSLQDKHFSLHLPSGTA